MPHDFFFFFFFFNIHLSSMSHKVNKNKVKTKNCESLNCEFNNHSLIDFTDLHHVHTAGMHTTHNNLFCKFLSITADLVRAKNRSQHRENSRLDRSRFRHMPRSPVVHFMLLLIQVCAQRLFKILFKCKSEKSNDNEHQLPLSKWRTLSVQSASLYSVLDCCDVTTGPMCFPRTAWSLTLN